MDDDGIVRGPAFDLENFTNGGGIQRIRGKAVNRFRRQRYHLAGAQPFCRPFHGGSKQRRRVRG